MHWNANWAACRQQANKDPLTGLHNRRMLSQCLQTLLERGGETGTDVCVLTADLDNFKLLNDTLGHPAGDDLLKAVGQIIRSTIRPTDLAFRCGGDEFVVLMPDAGPEAGHNLAHRVASLVDALGKGLRLSKPVGLSVGVTSASQLRSPDVERLLGQADQRLYAAKRERKGGLKASTARVGAAG